MWNKQRPTREGYYWLSWSTETIPFPVEISEDPIDGELMVYFFGETCRENLASVKFDKARWKPLAYSKQEMIANE